MMPLPLHLFDILCKCFLYQHCHGSEKSAMNEWKNEGVSVGYLKIFHNSPINKKVAVKFLIYLYKFCK